MWNGGRYVLMPLITNLTDQCLEYRDILTYITVRSFKNSENGECFPSYEAIAKKAGMSRNYVMASIKRLESTALIEVKRPASPILKREKNHYTFPALDAPTKLPVEFFTIKNLTSTEKGILLCIRQFFNTGDLMCYYDLNRMADLLGFTYQQLYKPFKSLITKGYILEKSIALKYSERCIVKRYLNSKLIDWNFGTNALLVEKPKKLVLKPTADGMGWLIEKAVSTDTASEKQKLLVG